MKEQLIRQRPQACLEHTPPRVTKVPRGRDTVGFGHCCSRRCWGGTRTCKMGYKELSAPHKQRQQHIVFVAAGNVIAILPLPLPLHLPPPLLRRCCCCRCTPPRCYRCCCGWCCCGATAALARLPSTAARWPRWCSNVVRRICTAEIEGLNVDCELAVGELHFAGPADTTAGTDPARCILVWIREVY